MCTSASHLPSTSMQVVAPEQLQQLQEQQTKAKRVSFHGSVKVWPYLHKNDLSDEERANVWYNESECLSMRAECSHTVQLHKQGKIRKDCTLWCFRGLELRTSEGAARRRENKYLAWDTVLNEQETQYVLGDFDAEIIASRYHAITAASRQAALANALQDAEAAAEHHSITATAVFEVHSRIETMSAPNKTSIAFPARTRRTVFNIAVPIRGASAAA